MRSTGNHEKHFGYELTKGCARAMLANDLDKPKQSRSGAPYTSRILKAGALIADTKTLLSHWDISATVDENARKVHRNNIFGKATGSRAEDILAIFLRR